MDNGGQPSSVVAIVAPIEMSGSVTRRMGRRCNDASPTNCESKRCAASTPTNRRIAVPELPMSKGAGGGLNPCNPAPSIAACPSRGPSICTPMARNAATVASTSSPSSSPLTRDVPWASEPRITARWDIDLSPGTRSRPLKLPPGLMK